MINLIVKDFKRLLSSPASTLGMMSIPLVIALLLGMAFGGGSTGTPRVTIALESHDDSWLASFYTGAFSREELKEMFDVSVVESGARNLVESDEVSAAVIIPENFGDDVLNGRETTITVVKNPSKNISPVIAETTVEIMNMVLSQLRMVLAGPMDRILTEMKKSEDSDADEMEVAAIAVMITREMNTIGQFAFPPAFELEVVGTQPAEEVDDTEKEEEKMNIYLFFFPGLIILGVFFVAEAYMSDLLEEQRAGTLSRILTAGAPPVKILTAKVMGCVLYCILSIIIMRLLGQILFDVGWGDPFAEMLTLLTSSMAMTGIMCVVFGFAANERQGSAISTIVVLTMSLLGGSMFPRRMMPTQIQKPGMLTPNYWSLEAWDALLIEKAALSEILFPLGILTVMGLSTLLIGSLMLTRKLSGKGVAL